MSVFRSLGDDFVSRPDRGLIERMTRISEAEFARIVTGIDEDRAAIIKHNPIGTEEEILLWMLLSCLISFLNLTEIETPCFTGTPTAATYRDAVLFVMRDRRIDNFDAEKYLEKLGSPA